MSKFTQRKKSAWFKTRSLWIAVCLLSFGLFQQQAHAEVPKIIFDSDMSSDWDDVADLAVLHGLASLGECEIIGMFNSSTNGATMLCMDAINTYYGKPDIPIGRRPDVGGIGSYPGQIASEYPHGPEKEPQDFPLAVDLYRKLLAASPDKSVIIATTGYLNNLEALLKSGSDAASPLNGIDLVKKKVKLWACAGGAFPSGGEFNFGVEPGAAEYVINHWPTAVTYTPYSMGHDYMTCGRVRELPPDSPVRRVFVDIEKAFPYPSWGQTAIYQAVRGSGELWSTVNVGRNNGKADGTNFWTETPDPNGPDDQAYLLGRARTPVRDGLDAMIMLSPNNGKPSRPGEPTDLRAKVKDKQVDLKWTDNAFNETGFVIEQRIKGSYREIARVDANVTGYSVNDLDSTSNQSFRVKASNATGDSRYAYVWIYSGWTESNIQNPSDLPLYDIYQSSNLRSLRAGGPNHITLNNDSTHGQTLAIDVDTGAAPGLYVYFFYQDPDNWYRLNYGAGTNKFEKRVGGTTTQIGEAANNRTEGNVGLRPWRIEVTPAGTLKFVDEGVTLLQVTDTLSFKEGKIGLGALGASPVWENFRFDAAGSGGNSAAMAPVKLEAKEGEARVDLAWTGSAGAQSYNLYRSPMSNGQGAVPVARGITGTSHSDSGLEDGTTYFYKVQAVNGFGSSGDSNEAFALPSSKEGKAPAPPGELMAWIQDSQVYLSWDASAGALSYSLYRSTKLKDLDATPIATGITETTYTNTGLMNGREYFYRLRAVSLSGASGDSAEVSATPKEGGGGGPAFTNASFEKPSINGFVVNPSDSGWTFNNNAGIEHNGSAYGAVPAPGGLQSALLQSVGGKAGAMSQSIHLPVGNYTIGFQAARRYNAIQPIRVSVGDKVVGTYTPAASSFAHITTDRFTIDKDGDYSVTFAAADESGDKTSFVDLITINILGKSSGNASGEPGKTK